MKYVLQILFALVVALVFSAPAVSAETPKTKAKLVATKTVKKVIVEKQCMKMAKHFWFVTNVGTYERPWLQGFCRVAQPVGPFADLA